MMLNIRVSETYVHVESGSPVPSGGTAAPRVVFHLDEFWRDYAVTAVFEGSGVTRCLANVADGAAYTVPWECVGEAGVVTVRVLGIREEGRAATLPATLQVADSGLPGALPEPPTPSAYEQYVNAVQGNADRAESAASSAQQNADAVAAAVEAIGDIPGMRGAAEAMLADAHSAMVAAEEAAEAASLASCRLTELEEQADGLLDRASSDLSRAEDVIERAEEGAAAVARAEARIRAVEDLVQKQDKRLANLFALHEGRDLTFVTDDAVADEKAVPAGALPYAEIAVIGGRSEVVGGAVVHHGAIGVMSEQPGDFDIFALPESVTGLEGYGVGVSDACFNSVDLVRRRFVRRIGAVDMGSLSWRVSNGFFYAHLGDPGTGVEPGRVGLNGNGLCAGYAACDVWPTSLPDKSFSLGAGYVSTEIGSIALRDDSFQQDLTAFRAAVSGKMLYYELASPVSTDLSALMSTDNLIGVGGGGTLSFLTVSDTVVVPSTVIYAVAGPSHTA